MSKPIPHGTLSGYSAHGCRCEPCAVASFRYNKRRSLEDKPRLVDATGTRRRVRALMWLGWTRAHIATELGITPGGLSRMMSPAWPTVTTRNASKVAAVYDQLCMKPGPSRLTAGHARSRGYAPPLAWDDIDNPNERPTYLRPAKSESTLLDDLEQLLDTAGPWTWAGITTRLGKSRNTIEQACGSNRGNRPDLLARIRSSQEVAA